MPKKNKKKTIIETEMEAFKEGDLHSGSKNGPIVKDKKQAIAIALNKSRKANKKK